VISSAFAQGIYFEAIDFKGKAIQVVSSGGPTVTTINADGIGPVVTLWSGEGPTSVLSGFTITGGLALAGPYYGGGIRIENASPTIINNAIVGNQACNYGAGIYVGGDPLLSNLTR